MEVNVGSVAEIDMLLEMLRRDIADLEKAKEVARRYEALPPGLGYLFHGVPAQPLPPRKPSGNPWQKALEELLADGRPHSPKEMLASLQGDGYSTTYFALIAHLKRAVARGEVVRKERGLFTAPDK